MSRIARKISLLLLFLLFSNSSGCQRRAADESATRSELSPLAIKQHNQGVALMGKFDYAGAHDVLQKVVDQNPNWLDAKIDLAIAKLNRRLPTDTADAIQILESAAVTDPNSARAKFCLGLILAHEGEAQRALPLFTAVVEMDPHDAYAAYYAGQCSLDLGKAEQALAFFQSAQRQDPSLRSAYYGAFQTLQRLGKKEEAAENLQLFQKMANNPQARLAEMKYSRMGPKADLRAAASRPTTSSPASGPLFSEKETCDVALAPLHSANYEWTKFDSNREVTDRPGTTLCDINGDGRLDLFIARGLSSNQAGVYGNAILLQTDPLTFTWAMSHPLTTIDSVNSALWGDFDNDGLVDVYLCRRGSNQLWRQAPAGEWNDVTDATKTAGEEEWDTIDGAMFDADHDGDLDLFLLNANGPNELFSNNLDGTFRPLAKELGLQGNGTSSSGIVTADLDGDRDVDIIVLHQEAPHDVYLNDRLWSYRPAEGFKAFQSAPVFAAVASDIDGDGRVELLTSSADGLSRWQADDSGNWSAHPVHVDLPLLTRGPLSAQDFDGDGELEALVTTPQGWSIVELGDSKSGEGAKVTFSADGENQNTWGPVAVAAFDVQHGPLVVASNSAQPPTYWNAGPGRFPFAAIQFTGQDNLADQMRSNASGIGIQGTARVGSQSTYLQSFRGQSGPGQSHQPLLVGLGTEPSIDYIMLVWPDGLFQTETQLTAGTLHTIQETQRQVSSCPVVFVSDGQCMRFVTDILGVGGLGFNLGHGEYGAPRPHESLLMPTPLMNEAARSGRFELAIGEPMEEACYLDSLRLVAYDLPAGWNLTLDERQATSDPQPTGGPIFYRSTILPQRCTTSWGEDVTERLAQADLAAVGPRKRDRRFIGRAESYSLVLEFAAPLTNGRDNSQVVLMIDGWIEYPYSQTMFAAWQAGASYDPPTLEARSTGGAWQIVHEAFGYPAGMPRQMTLPIDPDKLPVDTVALRITTTMEIYWDRIGVIRAESCPQAQRIELNPSTAKVQEVGFARRYNRENRRPDYDYSDRVPLWDTRHQAGYYSNFGDVLPLIESIDDAVVILGPGEELRIEIEAPTDVLPDGWSRSYVLEAHGWCKDRDLYTRDGESVEPLPRRADGMGDKQSESRRDELHRRFNQRLR